MTQEHDHGECISEALQRADQICAKRGVRLTPLRRQVLEEIWQSHEAVKAYDLIRQLSSADRSVKPPTIYRALDFLLAQGLIHRIESLNGFVGCDRPHKAHQFLLLICSECGRIDECGGESVRRALDREAARQGFVVQERVVELRGVCAACRSASTD